MSKLQKHHEDSKLLAAVSYLDGQISRLKEIRNQNTNRMIVLKEGNSWPLQFGEFIGSLVSSKPRYHIESVLINHEDGVLEVDYCREEDFNDFINGRQSVDDVIWHEGCVRLDQLKEFALGEKMNHYCRDWADHEGQHQQEAGVLDIDDLMEEYDFLQSATKAYIEAGREVE